MIAGGDDGVQVIDVSDPSAPVAKGAATDDSEYGFTKLDGAIDVAVFEDSDGSYIAVVAASQDDSVQLIDVSNPSYLVAKGTPGDGVPQQEHGR